MAKHLRSSNDHLIKNETPHLVRLCPDEDDPAGDPAPDDPVPCGACPGTLTDTSFIFSGHYHRYPRTGIAEQDFDFDVLLIWEGDCRWIPPDPPTAPLGEGYEVFKSIDSEDPCVASWVVNVTADGSKPHNGMSSTKLVGSWPTGEYPDYITLFMGNPDEEWTELLIS